jgi:hypothetical protein
MASFGELRSSAGQADRLLHQVMGAADPAHYPTLQALLAPLRRGWSLLDPMIPQSTRYAV